MSSNSVTLLMRIGFIRTNINRILVINLQILKHCFFFQQMNKRTLKWFIYTTIATTVLAFIYGMFYIYVCISVGTGFPILEFVFTIIDTIGKFIYDKLSRFFYQ